MGYWRDNPNENSFSKCLNPNACLTLTLENPNPNGICEEGYKGILCSQCAEGYGSQSDFTCS